MNWGCEIVSFCTLGCWEKLGKEKEMNFGFLRFVSIIPLIKESNGYLFNLLCFFFFFVPFDPIPTFFFN